MINETKLGQDCLDWFKQTGWDIGTGSHSAQRRDNAQAILPNQVKSALSRINPHLPPECIDQILLDISKPQSRDLIANNREFHSMLLAGVPVQYKKDDEIIRDHAMLIDFDKQSNNHFYAVNQFTVKGKCERRPDIICFINGLPIAVLELKNPLDLQADIWAAYNQLQTYKDDISDLFIYNTALVISDGLTARIGSLTANENRFMPWRKMRTKSDKPRLEWELETLVRGFFNPASLLEYIRFFVLFDTDGATISKKIAGYHQFHAVREAVKVAITASGKTSDKKAGVVWHTQGSGKSITMCCYAGMLLTQKEMNNPTLLVVTDRNDLDGQLFATFSNAQDLLKQKPVQAPDRGALRKLLAERETGGIIFTTVQKFSPLNDEETHPILNDRHNIVVISDEAHRSQYGLKARLSKDGTTYKYGYAKHMRDALPNASFIGFTGTPISLEDRDTRAVFGDYVSKYDIQDAVDDEATVPILYEPRQAKLGINHKDIKALSNQVDEIVEGEDSDAGERIKSKWSRLEKLVGSKPRIKQIAQDIITHYKERCTTVEGKAMIVAMSRDICLRLYDEIVALRPHWHDADPQKGQIKIIMTGSAADKATLKPHIHSGQTKKQLETRFRDPKDNLNIVIVCDMWLTGFDVPCCHTMYVDKPMKGHNLMQAIARVNRIFKGKEGGLVVDYIGIAAELKKALKIYTDSDGKGQPTVDIKEALRVMLRERDAIRGMFAKTAGAAGFDYSNYKTAPDEILLPAADYIIGLGDGKRRFLDLVLAMTKAHSLCATLDKAKQYNKEMAFLSAVKLTIAKLDLVEKKFQSHGESSTIQHILNNAIVAEGVTDIFKVCNLEKPDISDLSDEFLEEVRRMPVKNLAIALLAKLLNSTIKAKTFTNVVQKRNFNERLQETLIRYNNRSIETAQVIEELIDMAKDLRANATRNETLGLRPDEVAFYDALADNESATKELGDAILKKIAIEITETLQKSTTIDWQNRESVRAKLRIVVRRTLQKYKYPPDEELEAIELVLEQAEALADIWSNS